MKTQVEGKMPEVDCKDRSYVSYEYAGKINGGFKISGEGGPSDAMTDVHAVLNNGLMNMTYNCTVSAQCECCQGSGKWTPISATVGCNLTVEIDDDFANPLDFVDSFYKQDKVAYDACMRRCTRLTASPSKERRRCYARCRKKYPYSELLFATPYKITASWTDWHDFEKTFDGCK